MGRVRVRAREGNIVPEFTWGLALSSPSESFVGCEITGSMRGRLRCPDRGPDECIPNLGRVVPASCVGGLQELCSLRSWRLARAFPSQALDRTRVRSFCIQKGVRLSRYGSVLRGARLHGPPLSTAGTMVRARWR